MNDWIKRAERFEEARAHLVLMGEAKRQAIIDRVDQELAEINERKRRIAVLRGLIEGLRGTANSLRRMLGDG